MIGKDLPGALNIQPFNSDELPISEGTKSKIEKKKYPPLQFSLAGLQLKFSAIKKASRGLTIPANGVGENWIVKFPHFEFPEVPENEYAMMELARMLTSSSV